METIGSINDKMNALIARSADERVQVQGILTDVRGQIAVLAASVAAGTVATQADLDALGAKFDLAMADVQSISEPFPVPATTPIDPATGVVDPATGVVAPVDPTIPV